MRFMKIHVPYPAYLSDLDARQVVVSNQPYESQLRSYLDDGFQQSDVASVGLRALGWDCSDFVANHAGLCRQWSRERGRRVGPIDVARKATLAAIQEYRPDVLLMYHHSFFNEQWIRQLRRVVPGIRVFAWCGVSIERSAELANYDAILTCNVDLLKQFQGLALNAHHVPFAFDPASRVRALRCVSDGKYGVSFLGQVVTHSGFHADRASLLEQIADNRSIDIFSSWRGPTSPVAPSRVIPRLSQRLLRLLPSIKGYSGQRRSSAGSARWSSGGRIGRYATLHPPRYGLRYLRTMHDSVVTLNFQPQCAGSSASNMRLIEAAGVGGCLLTDHKDDLEMVLKPDHEVMVFRDLQECIDKIDRVLRQPELTHAIRNRAVARVHRDHNPLTLGNRLDAVFRSI